MGVFRITIKRAGDLKLTIPSLDMIKMDLIIIEHIIREELKMENTGRTEDIKMKNDTKVKDPHMKWSIWEILLSNKSSIRNGKRQSQALRHISMRL